MTCFKTVHNVTVQSEVKYLDKTLLCSSSQYIPESFCAVVFCCNCYCHCRIILATSSFCHSFLYDICVALPKKKKKKKKSILGFVFVSCWLLLFVVAFLWLVHVPQQMLPVTLTCGTNPGITDLSSLCYLLCYKMIMGQWYHCPSYNELLPFHYNLEANALGEQS